MSGVRIPKPSFKIENIVASANLGLEIDLYSIAYKVDDVEYEPEQFPGAILKLKEPKSSLLLFKNGKIICTGCTSEKQVSEAIKRTLKILANYSTKTGPQSKNPRFDIVNIVASAELGVELDLYSIAYKVKNVEYEPEQFPGAILKFQDPKSSLLLFKNGKVICTGARSESGVQDALMRAVRVMTPFASRPGTLKK